MLVTTSQPKQFFSYKATPMGCFRGTVSGSNPKLVVNSGMYYSRLSSGFISHSFSNMKEKDVHGIVVGGSYFLLLFNRCSMHPVVHKFIIII